jgi:hypothetical protein
MAFMARCNPFAPVHAWKRTVVAGLHGLTVLTAALNCVLLTQGRYSGVGVGMGYAPPVYALVLFVAMVLAWFFNGYKFGNPVEQLRQLRAQQDREDSMAAAAAAAAEAA